MKAANETDRLTAGPFSGSVAAPFRRKPLRELERDLQAAESTSSLPRVLGPAALIFFGVGGTGGGFGSPVPPPRSTFWNSERFSRACARSTMIV